MNLSSRAIGDPPVSLEPVMGLRFGGYEATYQQREVGCEEFKLTDNKPGLGLTELAFNDVISEVEFEGETYHLRNRTYSFTFPKPSSGNLTPSTAYRVEWTEAEYVGDKRPKGGGIKLPRKSDPLPAVVYRRGMYLVDNGQRSEMIESQVAEKYSDVDQIHLEKEMTIEAVRECARLGSAHGRRIERAYTLEIGENAEKIEILRQPLFAALNRLMGDLPPGATQSLLYPSDPGILRKLDSASKDVKERFD